MKQGNKQGSWWSQVERVTTEHDNIYLGGQRQTSPQNRRWRSGLGGRTGQSTREESFTEGVVSSTQAPGEPVRHTWACLLSGGLHFLSICLLNWPLPQTPSCPKVRARGRRTWSSASRGINPKTPKVRITANQLTTVNILPFCQWSETNDSFRLSIFFFFLARVYSCKWLTVYILKDLLILTWSLSSVSSSVVTWGLKKKHKFLLCN